MKGTIHMPSVAVQLLLIEFHKIMYSRPATGLFIYILLKCRSQVQISRQSIQLGGYLRVCKLAYLDKFSCMLTAFLACTNRVVM